ncbi:MAG: phosphonate ABC transporter substrate-binding protein [Zoogloeaceae bacterium]|nr:phosphonate ABC transporter substrate-binding protein [Zoogloeaceae bacterium]
MLRLSRCIAAIALMIGCAGIMPIRAAEKTELNFGIISTESSQNLSSVWQPFLEDMEERTGFKIKAFFATDYTGIVQGMRFGKVQLAWYGNKSAMEAVDRADGEVFARVRMADGREGYNSVLLAHKSSPITNEREMLDRAGQLVFANGDPNSTSGYLVPGYYVFAKNGANPAKIFKRVINGGHEVNALSVANRQVDVATCNSEVLEHLDATNPEKKNELKIIWTSPLIPTDPLVWRKDLPSATKKKLRDFFFSYGGNPKEKAILKALLWSGFKVSDNDQLLPIRQLELFKQRTETENNAELNDTEKQKRLAQIDKLLEKLNAKMAAAAKAGAR